MVVAAVAIFATKDHSATEPITWVLLIIGSLLVGFCEEVVSRGVLLVGLRGRFKEVMVWFLSSLFFGLLHLPNAFFGLGVAAVGQVFFAMAGGTLFYIARRASGTLLVPMVIHAIWDFASFAGEHTDTSFQVAQTALVVNIVLAAALIFFVLRPTRGRRVEQFGAAPVPATT